jgi:hypothetical protein
MIFDPKSIERLKAMGIDAQEYDQQLSKELDDQSSILQSLIEFFWGVELHGLESATFNNFYAKSGLPTTSNIHNAAYDLFNYLRLFKSGGKMALYKHRQAEWSGPIVRLDESDCPSPRLDLLAGKNEIYRGMSIAEFESGKLGQSWTTDVQVARRFATKTYEDQLDGIVAVAKLILRNVIHVFPEDSESEVVVASGSIISADKFDA